MASRVFAIADGRSATLEGDDAIVASFKDTGDDLLVEVAHAGGDDGELDVRLALMLASFAADQETPALFISQVEHMAQQLYEIRKPAE